MKFLVKEYSAEIIERYRKILFKIWDKKGPKIDKDLLTLMGFRYGQAEGGRIRISHVQRFLIEYLGEENAINLTKKILLTNPHKIVPKFRSGYDFEFNVTNIAEIDQYGATVDVIVDEESGTVTLTMTDGTTHNLKDAINNEDYGWEIEQEIREVILDYLEENVTYKTGLSVVINKLKYLEKKNGKNRI